MARLFPSQFPKEVEPDDPEFEVFESLRRLPGNFSVYYSKKFKGLSQSKEECEVDFLIFDGASTLLVVEVKGGLIEYDGAEDCWRQNGKQLKTAPERQASVNTHSLIKFLGHLVEDVNVGWCVCFPNCSVPNNISDPSGLPKAIIIDESGMAQMESAVQLVGKYYQNRFKRSGCNSKTGNEIEQKLTQGIGFIQKVGVRIAKDKKQLVEVTDQQFEVLEDMILNNRIAIRGYAGSGKTLLAQEFARRLSEKGDKVLLLFLIAWWPIKSDSDSIEILQLNARLFTVSPDQGLVSMIPPGGVQ